MGGRDLFFIIFGLLLCSLTVSVLLQNKEEEKWLWPKIILIYLAYFFSFNILELKIPILIIAAYFIIKKKSKLNTRIKFMALIFSLILFITINYVVPQMTLKQVYNSGKQVSLENRFERIDSSYYYTENSTIQNKLRRYNVDDPQIMFATWVYDNNDIAIKDYEWIWLYSYNQLDAYWSVNYYNDKGYSEAYIRFNRTGQEYLGIFKKDKNGKQYLESVIEGKFKQDGRPKSFLDMF
jgi:hypothetical protein